MAEQDQGISWQVLTHEHREHSTDWYWALGVGTLIGAGLSIFFGNILLAIILIIGAGSIGILSVRGPREHMVRIHQKGVSLDGTLYPYAVLQSFWVEEEIAQPRLYLTTSGMLTPRITVPLDDASHAGRVRHYLKRHIEEEEQSPHFGEHIAELFGL